MALLLDIKCTPKYDAPTRFGCIENKICRYTLKKQYRCKTYTQNLLFYLSKYKKLWILQKILKNENKTWPKTVVPTDKHIFNTNFNNLSQPVYPKNYYGGH
jgi:hypothetical protein